MLCPTIFFWKKIKIAYFYWYIAFFFEKFEISILAKMQKSEFLYFFHFCWKKFFLLSVSDMLFLSVKFQKDLYLLSVCHFSCFWKSALSDAEFSYYLKIFAWFMLFFGFCQTLEIIDYFSFCLTRLFDGCVRFRAVGKKGGWEKKVCFFLKKYGFLAKFCFFYKILLFLGR